MKIAVYTIVKNEAHHAERWDETTMHADRRLWLDTGSTDDTVRAARDLDIPVVQAEFRPFRFDDARNVALSLLPDDIDLCIHLDADETLSPGWREEIEQHPGVRRFSCTLVNAGGGSWGEVRRANIHARFGFRWYDPIHEWLGGDVPSGAVQHLENVQIIHHPTRGKDHSQYEDILRRATQENPMSDRMAFYYARELMYNGKWVEARAEFQRHLQLPSAIWPAERAESLRLLASIDHFPERWLLGAIAEAPERREPWVDLARLYHKDGRDKEALGLLHIAARRTDKGLYTTDPSAWDGEFDALLKEVEGGG